jgi:hypothetical protein
MSDTTLRDAALALAKAGWPVLPCDPNPGDHSKAPLTKHGHLDATRGDDIIREWWEKWPNALIGVKIPEDVVAIDIDPRNGGSRDNLTAALGPLPDTLTVRSGRDDDGEHLYFKRPAVTLRGHVPGVSGVDVKTSGYMIAPPSPHPATGKPYIANGPFISRGLAELPTRAVHALTPPPPRYTPFHGPGTLTQRRVQGLVHSVRNAHEGERDSTLYWAARRIFESAGPTTNVNACLDTIALAALGTGLKMRQIASTILSARKAAGG